MSKFFSDMHISIRKWNQANAMRSVNAIESKPQQTVPIKEKESHANLCDHTKWTESLQNSSIHFDETTIFNSTFELAHFIRVFRSYLPVDTRDVSCRDPNSFANNNNKNTQKKSWGKISHLDFYVRCSARNAKWALWVCSNRRGAVYRDGRIHADDGIQWKRE